LAFVFDSTGRPEVILMNADGSKLRQLTQTPITDTLYNYTVAWSGSDLPGGQRVAVTNYLPSQGRWERGATVRLMDIYGGLGPWLPAPSYNPQWSPDNAFLAYLSLDAADHAGLYMSSGLGTGQQRQIVDTAGIVSGTQDLLGSYAWSPSGAPGPVRLAYMVQGPWQDEPASQVVELSRMHARIYTILPNGTDRQLLLDLQPMPNGIIGLNWSPDGRYLLYLVDEQNNGCWTIHLLGAADRKVTELHAACVATRTALPSWSPDSRYIAFTGGSGGMAVLDWALSLEHPGAGVTWLTGNSGRATDMNPVWQPAGR
jgi:Tol biopolymer transport system component